VTSKTRSRRTAPLPSPGTAIVLLTASRNQCSVTIVYQNSRRLRLICI
jgi:hypothetical protein